MDIDIQILILDGTLPDMYLDISEVTANDLCRQNRRYNLFVSCTRSNSISNVITLV